MLRNRGDRLCTPARMQCAYSGHISRGNCGDDLHEPKIGLDVVNPPVPTPKSSHNSL